VGPPLVGFLLPRTPLRRVPLFRHALPLGRTCGTGVSTLPPVPSSGFLPLSTVLAARGSLENLAVLAVRRGPRRFAAFFHAARVPGASLQSFPFPRSRTRSRGPFLPCGFRVRLPPAQCPRDLHDRFPRLLVPTLCPSNPPEGGPGTHEPGRRFLAVVSPVASARFRVPHVPSPSHGSLGSPVSGRHARFEALLPPGVRSATIPALARLRPPAGALLGFSPFRVFSTTVPGSVSREATRGGLKVPLPHAPSGVQPSRLHSATRTPTLGSRTQDPPTRVVYRTRASLSGGDPAHPRL